MARHDGDPGATPASELRQALAREERIARALREVGAALGTTLELDALLELILGRLTDLLEVFFPRASATSWRFSWEVVEISPHGTSTLLGLTITTAEVIHASGAPSTALRLSDGRSVLAYSGDTEWTDALIAIADGADLFITECYEHARLVTGHLSWSVLRTKLPALKARRIMITHMNPSMLARTEEAKDLGVLIAEDGLSLEV